MADTKWSQFPSATPDSADEVVGLHAGGNARFSLANLVYAVRNGLGNIFQSKITANGILKGDGQGGVSSAVAGTDYQAPLTAGTDYATPAQLDGKANQSQLAYVNTGTTATQNYSVGDYICWNGLLYTANQAISSGTTLSSATNGNLTECVGGGFNSVRVSHLDYVTTSDLTLSPMSNGFYDVTSAIPAGYEPISGKIVAPTVAAQTYLIVWFNEWMGTIRCNVFLIGGLARTVPTGTKIRIFIVKK